MAMTESIAPIQSVAEATLRQEPWTLPAPPQASDTVRFEAVLDAPTETDAPRRSDDITVPERTDKAGEFGEKLLRGVVEMDQNYQKIMDRLFDWPSFRSYLQKQVPEAGNNGQVIHHSRLDSGTEAMPDFDAYMNRTIASETHTPPATVHHSHVHADETGAALEEFSAKLDAIRERTHTMYEAGIEYSSESTRWYLSTEFWLTKVRILTSAVAQTSQGLTTLFRSGG
jgi:hypothetical protein